MNSISIPRLNLYISSWCTDPRQGTVSYTEMKSGQSHQHRMEFACPWPCFFCFFRMDDIQLCKDIMNLKKELQSLVAIPGNGCLQLNITIMLGWCMGGDGVRNTPLPLTIRNLPARLSFISLSSSPYFFFLFSFLSLISWSLNFFSCCISLLPWQQPCKYHSRCVFLSSYTQGKALSNLKGTKWHRDCQVEKTKSAEIHKKKGRKERDL